jgi:hypothetical protein
MKLDDSGKVIISWWLQNLKEWKINWYADPKHVTLVFDSDNHHDKNQEDNTIAFFIPSVRNAPGTKQQRELEQRRKLQGNLKFHGILKCFSRSRIHRWIHVPL